MNSTRNWFQPTGRRTVHEITEWYKKLLLAGLSSGDIQAVPPAQKAASLS
jgi:hypothetical protein